MSGLALNLLLYYAVSVSLFHLWRTSQNWFRGVVHPWGALAVHWRSSAVGRHGGR